MKEIKVGLLGCGFMGRAHMAGYQTIPLYYNNDFKIKFAGVCNRTLEKAEYFKEAFGFEYATSNPEDILNDPSIDVIDICTPNANHKNEILKALDNKKHIYCEKPVVVGEEEIKAVLSHPNLDKVTTQVVFNNRFYPAAIRAKQLIGEGRLGKIFSFRGVMLHNSSVDVLKPVSWRQTVEGNGGVVYDLSAHLSDMVYNLLGEFESVYTKNQIAHPVRKDKDGKDVKIEIEDATYSLVKLKNGAMGTMETTKIATGKNGNFKLEIHGEKGALALDLIDPNWLYFYDNTAPASPNGGMKGFTKIETMQRYGADCVFPPGNHTLGFLRAHVDCLHNFLTCVSKGAAANPSIKDGLYVQSVLEAMHKSAKTRTEAFVS
ncbi:Oxidoreductase family protein [Elusimicrobium minutum Pei191]|uniref:Oxidoreductase family protein n=1 Tax=Elusimicrobium minutum (strain Pei191) TaxID=445932 RepID=B2KB04_ELUMP|nr:Gfo/Idh/MocA family oxidoreductase [Elusimicrobium minutum]ACC97763.1 Oxidoreductase family protein [Elusimicrobium minutum Pei191]